MPGFIFLRGTADERLKELDIPMSEPLLSPIFGGAKNFKELLHFLSIPD
jgi:hypothetical protein